MKPYLIVIIVLFLSSSCATVTQQNRTSTIIPPNQSQILALNHWHMNGAMGLMINRQHYTSSITSQQKSDDYNINLCRPVSMSILHLVGHSNDVTVATSVQPPIAADDREGLWAQTLGWSLPVSNMRYWVRVLPAPN